VSHDNETLYHLTNMRPEQERYLMDFLVPCRHLVLLLVALGDGKDLLLMLGIKLIRFALEKSMIFSR